MKQITRGVWQRHLASLPNKTPYSCKASDEQGISTRRQDSRSHLQQCNSKARMLIQNSIRRTGKMFTPACIQKPFYFFALLGSFFRFWLALNATKATMATTIITITAIPIIPNFLSFHNLDQHPLLYSVI